VNAIGRACECNVEAIVDDHACRGASCHGKQIVDERRQLRGFEIPLANLDDVDAGGGGVPRLVDEAAPCRVDRRARRREATAIGNQAEHHGSSERV
jgi:hypothetical protein